MTVKIGKFYPAVLFHADSVKELSTILTAKFEKGLLSPIYMKGTFVSHIALDFFTPLSLCGLQGEGTSNTQAVTIFGAVCPVCKNRYAKPLQKFMATRLAALDATKAKAEAAGEDYFEPEATDGLREAAKSSSKLFAIMK